MCWIRGGWEDRRIGGRHGKLVDLLLDILDIMVWMEWMDGLVGGWAGGEYRSIDRKSVV